MKVSYNKNGKILVKNKRHFKGAIFWCMFHTNRIKNQLSIVGNLFDFHKKLRFLWFEPCRGNANCVVSGRHIRKDTRASNFRVFGFFFLQNKHIFPIILQLYYKITKSQLRRARTKKK